jgi:Cytochrome c
MKGMVEALSTLRTPATLERRSSDDCRARALAAVLLAALAGSLGCQTRESPLVKQGKAAFTGSVPLKAHMVGHTTELPPSAVRCQNCHQTGPAPASATPAPTVSSERPSDSFGPILNRSALTEARRRRGGPPSKYDAAAFCRLLKDGVDPAHVIIPMTMPRYQLSQQECDALWEYLLSQ